MPADFFFAFWIPIVDRIGAGNALVAASTLGVALLALPWVTARRDAHANASTVDEQLCVGCNQCALDCPYAAIAMVERANRSDTLVARVDPTLCVSCGICAGSCPPMGVGPPGRTGRDQMTRVRRFVAEPVRRPGEIVVVCCNQGAGTFAGAFVDAGAAAYPIDCAGNLHTSVIEVLLRSGAGGVLVLACPPRDCWHREGPKWLVERVYHGREAELQSRVNPARVRVECVNSGDRARAIELVRAFARDVVALDRPAVEDGLGEDIECAAAGVEVRQS